MKTEPSNQALLAQLEQAVRSGDRERIDLALKAGASVNDRLLDGDPIIMRFINDRDFAGIRRLKELGVDLEARTRAGDALVIDSAIAGDWDVVLLLLELGADPKPPAARLPLDKLLQSRTPSPDSPIYPFKMKVRDRLELDPKK